MEWAHVQAFCTLANVTETCPVEGVLSGARNPPWVRACRVRNGIQAALHCCWHGRSSEAGWRTGFRASVGFVGHRWNIMRCHGIRCAVFHATLALLAAIVHSQQPQALLRDFPSLVRHCGKTLDAWVQGCMGARPCMAPCLVWLQRCTHAPVP